MDKIILFDGDCHFCDRSVQFIIKRDKKERFAFASLRSDVGKELLIRFHVPQNINSFVLIEGNSFYLQSTAALLVCKNLKGAWKCLSLFLIVPRPVRDFFYQIIAKNRYKWFGKKSVCRIPTEKERKRFL